MLPPLSKINLHSNGVIFDSWAGFRLRPSAYTHRGLDAVNAVSDGSTDLYIEPNRSGVSNTLSPEQIAAYNYLHEHEEAIQEMVLQHIFEAYPELQEVYYDDDEERAEHMPNLERPGQLSTLIGLADVIILNLAKDGIAYMGFHFHSTWDPEHGFSVTLHKERIVSEVGGPGEIELYAERDAQAQ